MEKLTGQALVDKLAAWFRAYLYLENPDTALVLALWAIGSWTFDRFFTWPYLAVTASVKGAGKSRTLALLRLVCRGSFLGVGNPERDYVPELVEGEGLALADAIQAVLSEGDSSISSNPPEWLDTRDREIWGAIFGLAAWLRLDRGTVTRLQRFAADNVASKTCD